MDGILSLVYTVTYLVYLGGYGVPIIEKEDQCDCIIWMFTSNDVYSSKFAYLTMPSWHDCNQGISLEKAFEITYTSRWLHFLWLACKDQILTNQLLFKGGICANTACSFCEHSNETMFHVFRDYTIEEPTQFFLIPKQYKECLFNCAQDGWLMDDILVDPKGKVYMVYS